MNSFFRRAAVFFLVSAASLLLVEFALRFFNPPALQYYRDVKLLHAYHPDYGVSLQPNESRFVRHYSGAWEGRFTTNSLGQRGKKEPDPNASKLLCLGDSMVMGFGVSDEDTFCSQLDELELSGEKYQALNIGVDAYGSLGAAKRLEDMTNQLTNVKEVLFFISPNDFTMPEVLRNQGILPDDETDALHENDLVWKRNFHIQFEATRISFFLQALKLGYEQTKVQIAISQTSARTEIQSLFTNPLQYIKESFSRTPKKPICDLTKSETENQICPEPSLASEFPCTDKPSPPESLPPLPNVTIAAYERMIALSKAKNFKLTPVFLPMQMEEIFCYAQGKYSPLGNYSIQAESFWEKKKVDTIKLLPYVKKMCGAPFQKKTGEMGKAGIKDYFIPGDGHLTKIGNRWVSDALKEELKKGIR
ncbi:lipase [Leptospira kobayashii]|uniref:Lipase n=1 Tax=Leptospira kobayashii TaxID=1917830 RepID=A0ABN6KER1_9LEPT|nr:lipase [Leptospira kobayashii]BDA79537.1 lipase [Leptospira kobayashii]